MKEKEGNNLEGCKIIYLFSCLVVSAVLSFFIAFATLSNDSPLKGQALKFSKMSGFYGDEFTLEISSPVGTTVYYTLDSSEPDKNAMLYSNPILIEDRSSKKNIYSQNKNISMHYGNEAVERAGKGIAFGEFVIPEEPVDKATIVRAVALDGKGRVVARNNAVYWIGFDEKKGYDDIGIVSIVTDPDNLFDYEKGIYVYGKVFDDSLVNGEIVEEDPHLWWTGNYTQHGKEWERPAWITFWDMERRLIYDGTAGIRIQGLSSREQPNKSLNLFAREEYGTKSFPGEIFFSDGYPIGSMTLYNGAQGSSKLPDYLVNTLASDLNISTREFEPYNLFLDGEYWGVYYLTPRFEEEYFEAKYNVYGSDVVEIKVGNVEIGTPNDILLYNDMVSWIASNDMSIPENYQEACRMIDMKSYLDYYATEIYIATGDWPDNNIALWRTRDTGVGDYYDGRWRWILFDVNLSMSYPTARMDWVEYAASKSETFASLLYNDDFKASLEERLVYLAQNNFNPKRVNAFIDDYEEKMAAPMELEYKRFYGDNRTVDDFYVGCEDIRLFFNRRYDYIMKTYGNLVD